MIVELSFKNNETKKQVDTLVGKSYSIFTKIKMGGAGSSRMILKEWSAKFENYLTPSEKLKYVSIELRPKGILVHWSKNYSHFAWVIPYYKLSIFKSDILSIRSEGNTLKMEKGSINLSISKFLSKLLELKAKANHNINEE